ncbi:MAG: DUF2497 domain-containing protein [Pseudomonadota bacterium]
MEEILASIRKIISEDGEAKPKAKAAPSAPPPEPEPQSDPEPAHEEETLSASDLVDKIEDDEVFFEEEVLTPQDLDDEELTPQDLEDHELPDAAELHPSEEGFVEDPPSALEELIEPAAIERISDEAAEETARSIESIIHGNREADMAASAKYQETVLTEEATAETAAGALGKLISTMDFGGENTIEGLVRELLKPMIKDWLDANLPGIVDEKVEAEVQRIARMAR